MTDEPLFSVPSEEQIAAWHAYLREQIEAHEILDRLGDPDAE